MSESIKYSTVDGLDIYIDYIVPKSATKEKPAPIYLWFVSGYFHTSLCWKAARWTAGAMWQNSD